VPAGRYRVSLEDPPGEGLLRVRAGKSRQPLLEEPPGSAPIVSLAVDVEQLAIACEDPQGRARGLPTLQPLHIVPPRARPSRRRATAAARYQEAAVFALDRGVDLERSGFWVAGGRTVEVVVVPGSPVGSAGLRVRNAPVANEISLELGSWRFVRTFAPAEEALIPLPRAQGVLRIGTASGFRPRVAGDAARPRGRPGGRFLGAFVKAERGR
jgi:hypothetical protein